MEEKGYSTLEEVVDCKNPHVGLILFEFKMGLDLFFKKESEMLPLIIELTKDLAHLFNKVDEFNQKEDSAIARLKKDIRINHWGEAIKMPYRWVCEKLFKEIMQDAALIRRRHAKLIQILFGRGLWKPIETLLHFKKVFWEHSKEFSIMHDNNAALKFLWDVRWEIEHPKGRLQFIWLQIINNKVIPSFFSYEESNLNVRKYIVETAEFLFFLTEFLIASWLSSSIPGIKYSFTPKPKKWGFRWNAHFIIEKGKLRDLTLSHL